MPNSPCLICQKELSDGEVSLNRQWHFDCMKCSVCHEEMPNSEQILKCLDAGLPPMHTGCAKSQAFNAFRTELPKYQIHLDVLNNELDAFFPVVNVAESDLEVFRRLMISCMEAAKNLSYILTEGQRNLHIASNNHWLRQESLRARDKKEKDRSRAAAEVHTAARSAVLSAERKNPELRKERKAIEALMKNLGLSEEQAKLMLAPPPSAPKGK